MCRFVTELGKLSSAEEFFEALGVAFDPAVLRVKRLHILKRFQHYLGTDPGANCSEEEIQAFYRGALEAAYRDFVTSDALTERVFKVLQDAVPAPAFVPIAALERFR